MTHPFDPDWVLAPAAILRDWMEEHQWTLGSLATGPGEGDFSNRQMLTEVMDRKPLTSEHAELLERCTGVPAATWLSAERLYRDGLAAGKKDVT